MQVPEPRKQIPNGVIVNEPMTNGISSHRSRSKTKTSHQQYDVDITQEIAKTVQNIKLDLDRLTNKINSLENAYQTLALQKKKKSGLLDGMSPHLIAFLILWPFLASFITAKFIIRK